MKKNIHPTYHKAKVVCTSCGAEFETGSVLSEIKVDYMLKTAIHSILDVRDSHRLKDVSRSSIRSTV